MTVPLIPPLQKYIPSMYNFDSFLCNSLQVPTSLQHLHYKGFHTQECHFHYMGPINNNVGHILPNSDHLLPSCGQFLPYLLSSSYQRNYLMPSIREDCNLNQFLKIEYVPLRHSILTDKEINMKIFVNL